MIGSRSDIRLSNEGRSDVPEESETEIQEQLKSFLQTESRALETPCHLLACREDCMTPQIRELVPPKCIAPQVLKLDSRLRRRGLRGVPVDSVGRLGKSIACSIRASATLEPLVGLGLPLAADAVREYAILVRVSVEALCPAKPNHMCKLRLCLSFGWPRPLARCIT